MVNWSDSKEIAIDSGVLSTHIGDLIPFIWNLNIDVFLKLIFSLFGVYIWELFMTWDFEWSLLSRRRTFRWPLVRVYVLSCSFIECFLTECVINITMSSANLTAV